LERFREHDLKVLRGEPIEMPVFEDVLGDDGHFHCYLTNKVKTEWEGRPAVLGAATEITDLMKEKRRSRRRLRLLRSVINLVPIIINCKGRDGNYRLANNQFLEFLGYRSFEELKGKKVADLLSPDAAAKVNKADELVLKGIIPEPVELSLTNS